MTWDDEWILDEEERSFAERFDNWRRHYLPLPDEVVYQYLAADEYVIHTDRPGLGVSLWMYRLVAIVAAVTWMVISVVVLSGWSWGAAALLVVVGVIALNVAGRRLSASYTSYVVTNLRLLRCSGVVSRKMASLTLARVIGLSYREEVIRIEAANATSGFREIAGLSDMATFYELILEGLAISRGERDAFYGARPPTRGTRRRPRPR